MPSAAVGCAINILATLLVIVFVALLGYVSRYVFGRWIIGCTERVIGKLPFISVIYNSSKQIIGTFSDNKRAVHYKVALVGFPNENMRSIGFITGKTSGVLADAEDNSEEMFCVFVPTTPNPTSGFFIIVPKSRCTILDIPMADAMKMIISGGAFMPNKDEECHRR
jgi:uncharacterized membrane protein